MKPPTAILADDEPLLRDMLKAKLAKLWPELSIVAEATNGAEALQQFETQEPDILFLDIHMPVMTGLEAARLIGKGRNKRAHLVFITAFDQHAVEAFERGAIDYVLKPFNEDRLKETIERLKERLAQPQDEESDDLTQVLRQLTAQLSGGEAGYLKWIKASVGQTVRLIAVDEIVYFQSDEKYTRVVMDDGEVLIRKPIKELLAELDPHQFWQIHRATIVNTKAIAGVVRGLRDQADLKLKTRPETLTVSRNFTHLFKQM
ncbi:MAG: response regulator transcription factor [Betaproteobacteria bacterium]|nr:response regulator transcription factor [Betaproteobacteria bacterium]